MIDHAAPYKRLVPCVRIYSGTTEDFMKIVEANRSLEDRGMYFDGGDWKWRKSWIRRFFGLPEPKRLKYIDPNTGAICWSQNGWEVNDA